LKGRRTLLGILGLLALLVTVDLRQPPPDQVTARAMVGAIHVYQASLSRLYARMGVRCRFTPTCSHYGASCIGRFGAVRGGWMALKRVVRCGPWTAAGTVDPAPGSV
jgi:putative membrane protein insertion efficiency factor